MPLSALALVLLAAVLHASWNIAAKHAGDRGLRLLRAGCIAADVMPLAGG